MSVGVIIPTIGKTTVLDTVLKALADQQHPPTDVIVVDQSSEETVAGTVEAFEERLPIRRITGGRGTSAGKNHGLNALLPVDVVVFLDDDCTMPPDFLARLVGVFEETGADIIAGAVTTHGEHRVNFGKRRETVTRDNVWTHTIEAATFYRRDLLNRMGGFDVTLGTGGPTRWQSGEGTDLVLRALGQGAQAVYEPTLVITENQAPTTPSDYLAKVRKYGRGTGRVYRLHYPVLNRVAVVLRPAAAAIGLLVCGRRSQAVQKAQAALGRAEGIFPILPIRK